MWSGSGKRLVNVDQSPDEAGARFEDGSAARQRSHRRRWTVVEDAHARGSFRDVRFMVHANENYRFGPVGAMDLRLIRRAATKETRSGTRPACSAASNISDRMA